MRYSYDNSAENVRNPNSPPRRVAFGPQSIDEMGELWLQVLPRRPGDLASLQSAHRLHSFRETATYYENQLSADPNDALTHFGFAKVLGPLGQIEKSMRHFEIALQLQPNLVEGHYYLGLVLYHLERWVDARREFETVLRLKPDHAKAHDGLGLVHLQLQNFRRSAAHFETALQINPNDAVARRHLEGLAGQLDIR